MAQLSATFEQICYQSGITNPGLRGPEHVRFETATVRDYDVLGQPKPGTEREEVFAVPREILAPNEPWTGNPHIDNDIGYSKFELRTNGSAVSRHIATEEGRLHVGARSIIRPRVSIMGDVIIGLGCDIFPRAQLEASMIGDHVNVGYDSEITATVVEDGARIGDRVLLVGCSIGRLSLVENEVSVGIGTSVGRNGKLGAGTSVGENCVIKDNFTAKPGAKVEDRARIEENVMVDTGYTVRRGARVKADLHLRVVKAYKAVKRPKAA